MCHTHPLTHPPRPPHLNKRSGLARSLKERQEVLCFGRVLEGEGEGGVLCT